MGYCPREAFLEPKVPQKNVMVTGKAKGWKKEEKIR